jgi:hypothetical protein
MLFDTDLSLAKGPLQADILVANLQLWAKHEFHVLMKKRSKQFQYGVESQRMQQQGRGEKNVRKVTKCD